jgi:hypothetical protein
MTTVKAPKPVLAKKVAKKVKAVKRSAEQVRKDRHNYRNSAKFPKVRKGPRNNQVPK